MSTPITETPRACAADEHHILDSPPTPIAGLRPQRAKSSAANLKTLKRKTISEKAVWKLVQEGWIDENGNDIRDVKVSARPGFEFERKVMIPADYSYGEFGEFSDFSQHPNYSKKHHSRVSTYDSNFDAAWSDTDVTDAIDDLDGPWHNPIWFGNPAEGKFLEDSVVINMPDFATAKEYSSNAAAYAKLKLHSSPLLVPMNFGGSRLRDIMQDGTSGAGLSLPIPRPRPTTRIEEIANAGATARPKSRPTTMGLPTSKLSILQIEDLAKKKERRAMRLSKTSKNDKKRSTGGTGRIQGTLFERKRKRVDSEEESIGEESSESSSGNMETEEGYSTDESEIWTTVTEIFFEYNS